MKGSPWFPRDVRGFTLMELMTVIAIIFILILMILPAFGFVRGKAERATCSANLRGLYVAAAGYVQEHQQWPQIHESSKSATYAERWLAALEKQGISRKNWICPSVQRQMGNPDIYAKKDQRLDYFATPFDDRASTPFRWATQPWFVERGDVHGNGNLLVLSTGQVLSLKEAIRDMRSRTYNYEQ